MANWLLFYNEADKPLVIGPTHHLVFNNDTIREDDSPHLKIAEQTFLTNDAREYHRPLWRIGKLGYFRHTFDICDGEESPWPEFDSVKPSELGD
jgi:galactose mutarotase-like enzyme